MFKNNHFCLILTVLQDNALELWGLTSEDVNSAKDFPPKLLDSVRQDGNITQIRVCSFEMMMYDVAIRSSINNNILFDFSFWTTSLSPSVPTMGRWKCIVSSARTKHPTFILKKSPSGKIYIHLGTTVVFRYRLTLKFICL